MSWFDIGSPSKFESINPIYNRRGWDASESWCKNRKKRMDSRVPAGIPHSQISFHRGEGWNKLYFFHRQRRVFFSFDSIYYRHEQQILAINSEICYRMIVWLVYLHKIKIEIPYTTKTIPTKMGDVISRQRPVMRNVSSIISWTSFLRKFRNDPMYEYWKLHKGNIWTAEEMGTNRPWI